MICGCGKEHNGTYGSKCEDCWADVSQRWTLSRKSMLDANPCPHEGYKPEPDSWQHRTPRQHAKMGMRSA